MKSSPWQKKNFSHTASGTTRTTWAIHHRLGVSLVRARSGVQAAAKAKRLFGDCAAPYTILKNQDQEIIYAQAMGARIH